MPKQSDDLSGQHHDEYNSQRGLDDEGESMDLPQTISIQHPGDMRGNATFNSSKGGLTLPPVKRGGFNLSTLDNAASSSF